MTKPFSLVLLEQQNCSLHMADSQGFLEKKNLDGISDLKITVMRKNKRNLKHQVSLCQSTSKYIFFRICVIKELSFPIFMFCGLFSFVLLFEYLASESSVSQIFLFHVHFHYFTLRYCSFLSHFKSKMIFPGLLVFLIFMLIDLFTAFVHLFL